MKVNEAIDRWGTTDDERNIRFNLLKTFEKPAPDMTLLETNMSYVAGVKNKLEAQGFTMGRAGVFASFYPEAPLRSLVMLGVAAGIVLYLSLVIPAMKSKQAYILLAVLALVMVVPVLMGHGNKIRVAAALAAANVFPAISVLWILDKIRQRVPQQGAGLLRMIGTGVAALFVCGMISYVGAAYLSASLADTEYL